MIGLKLFRIWPQATNSSWQPWFAYVVLDRRLAIGEARGESESGPSLKSVKAVKMNQKYTVK